MTRALITGITGQDGSYLAEQLAAEGCEVFGLIRSTDHPRVPTLRRLVPSATLVVGDLRDPLGLRSALDYVRPGEIYNLAAVTTPGEGWTVGPTPLVGEVTGLGAVNLLRVTAQVVPDARFVQASSSAVYDPGRYGLYGVSKKLAHDAVVGFRERLGLHASNAVMFSHTSPRQSPSFLVRRIVRHVADVKRGRPSDFVMTSRRSRRDWGWAPDYVRALPALARTETPHDHDVRTAQTFPVYSVALLTAAHLDVPTSAITAGWPDQDQDRADGEVVSTHHALCDLPWVAGVGLAEVVRALADHEMSEEDPWKPM